MTGRTHDLAAFTALVAVFVYMPVVPTMSLATVITAVGANFIGGLFPDIDQPTSDFWDNFRLGPFFAKIICPLFGGHRHFSHSLIGLLFIGWVSSLLLGWLLPFILININGDVVWASFMIGMVSHLLMDLPTKEGVPLLWPWDYGFGIPPFKSLRITTGKFFEKILVFPGLLALTAYLLYDNQSRILEFLRAYIK
jgi:inner membrane protein